MGRAIVRDPAAFLMDELFSTSTPSYAFRCDEAARLFQQQPRDDEIVTRPR